MIIYTYRFVNKVNRILINSLEIRIKGYIVNIYPLNWNYKVWGKIALTALTALTTQINAGFELVKFIEKH